MDMFILIFVLSFISVIGACIFHWWKERLKNKDEKSKLSGDCCFDAAKGVSEIVVGSNGAKSTLLDFSETNSVATREAYLKQYPSITDYINSFKFEEENTISKELKVTSDIVSKWKQSTPKHKKRIQNRNKRKQRNK